MLLLEGRGQGGELSPASFAEGQLNVSSLCINNRVPNCMQIVRTVLFGYLDAIATIVLPAALVIP